MFKSGAGPWLSDVKVGSAAIDRDGKTSAPTMIAKLPQEDPLPCAELQAAAGNRNRKRNTGQCRFDVRWHVIIPFHHMGIVSHPLGGQMVEAAIQVCAYRRIRILIDHQSGRSMMNENIQKSLFRQLADGPFDMVRDQMKTTTERRQRYGVLLNHFLPKYDIF